MPKCFYLSNDQDIMKIMIKILKHTFIIHIQSEKNFMYTAHQRWFNQNLPNLTTKFSKGIFKRKKKSMKEIQHNLW